MQILASSDCLLKRGRAKVEPIRVQAVGQAGYPPEASKATVENCDLGDPYGNSGATCGVQVKR